ncbi:pep-cterm sorting domain-containing protein [Anaeramoeba ignava]|uniref:Pep-cterm sorting domain-containing protein n=1 Tax=Anaeramoeba ignava TaxID=1746090 RepID=A0A9Q0L785_ANAIG|nr:pep-cterm sorting domain-containing protein [Anaeramoeba ignava]
MKLGFSAKRDGFDYKKWHNICDDKGKTLIIIQTKDNFIFGGFTQFGWISGKEDRWTADSKAFLFSIKNPKNDRPQKFPVRKSSQQHAIRYAYDRGPIFGGDIKLVQNLQPYGMFFGNSYTLPKGISSGTEEAFDYLAGSSPKITELETFFI